MKYAGINYNDFAAAPGVSVTFFTQGCPHRCKNCHNPETWDFNGGKEFDETILLKIENALFANGIQRNLCIMGGEPMCESNLSLTHLLVNYFKNKYPTLNVYIWTGYLIENLNNPLAKEILSKADYLIDGPYVESLRDITLEMRGSSNQRIINLREIDKD